MATPIGLPRALRRALDIEDLPPLDATRPTGPMALLNPRRLEIVLAAAAYPGIHVRSAARLLLQSPSSIRFHVDRLVALGLLRTAAFDRRTCLFVPTLYRGPSEPLLARWADPTDRAVLEALRSRRAATRGELLRTAGLRKSALDRSLRRLRGAAAVRTRLVDRRLVVSLAPPWRRLERECATGGDRRLRRFLGLLTREGLRPSVDGRDGDRARLSVDGPRGRIRLTLPLDPLADMRAR